MSNFLQFTVFGVMLGAGYAIAATGLVVTYTTSGVFNFAQGAVGMIAAFGYWELVSAHNVPTWAALLIVLILGASIAGAFVERVLMRRLHGASAERPVMVTLGLMVILTGVATVVWSPTVQRTVDPQINGQFRLVGINIQNQYVLIIGVAIAVALGLRLLFYSTRTGYALRAVVDDPDLLGMAGVSPNRMSQYGWILGFIMAALSGVLLAPTQTDRDQHRGHDPAGGQRLRGRHRGSAQEHPADLRRRHRHRARRELRHSTTSSPTSTRSSRPMSPAPCRWSSCSSPWSPCRRCGCGPSAGSPRCGRPGWPAAGSPSLGGLAFLVVAVVMAVAFSNTNVNGTTLLTLGRHGDVAWASSASRSSC